MTTLTQQIYPGDHLYALVINHQVTSPYWYSYPPVSPELLAYITANSSESVNVSYAKISTNGWVNKIESYFKAEPEASARWQALVNTHWDLHRIGVADEKRLTASSTKKTIAASSCMKLLADIIETQGNDRLKYKSGVPYLEEVRNQLFFDTPLEMHHNEQPIIPHLHQVLVVKPSDGLLQTRYINPAVYLPGVKNYQLIMVTIMSPTSNKAALYSFTRHHFCVNTPAEDVMLLSQTNPKVMTNEEVVQQTQSLYSELVVGYYLVLKSVFGKAEVFSNEMRERVLKKMCVFVAPSEDIVIPEFGNLSVDDKACAHDKLCIHDLMLDAYNAMSSTERMSWIIIRNEAIDPMLRQRVTMRINEIHSKLHRLMLRYFRGNWFPHNKMQGVNWPMDDIKRVLEEQAKQITPAFLPVLVFLTYELTPPKKSTPRLFELLTTMHEMYKDDSSPEAQLWCSVWNLAQGLIGQDVLNGTKRVSIELMIHVLEKVHRSPNVYTLPIFWHLMWEAYVMADTVEN